MAAKQKRASKPKSRKNARKKTKLKTEQLAMVAVVFAILVVALVLIIRPGGYTAQFGAAKETPVISFIFDDKFLLEQTTADLYDITGELQTSQAAVLSIKDTTGKGSFSVNGETTSQVFLLRTSLSKFQVYQLKNGKATYCCVWSL